MDDAPAEIVLEFIRSSGEPVRLLDLGSDFLDENQITSPNHSKPYRIAIAKKLSKAGNSYYEYSQNGLPLPDGLNTYLRVDGTVLPFGKTRASKTGHPTREGQAKILLSGTLYKVTAYITEAKFPFYVKVVAHKNPNTSENVLKAQKSPRGGRIV